MDPKDYLMSTERMKLSSRSSNLRVLLNALADEWSRAVVTGREELWAECARGIINFFAEEGRQEERQDDQRITVRID